VTASQRLEKRRELVGNRVVMGVGVQATCQLVDACGALGVLRAGRRLVARPQVQDRPSLLRFVVLVFYLCALVVRPPCQSRAYLAVCAPSLTVMRSQPKSDSEVTLSGEQIAALLSFHFGRFTEHRHDRIDPRVLGSNQGVARNRVRRRERRREVPKSRKRQARTDEIAQASAPTSLQAAGRWRLARVRRDCRDAGDSRREVVEPLGKSLRELQHDARGRLGARLRDLDCTGKEGEAAPVAPLVHERRAQARECVWLVGSVVERALEDRRCVPGEARRLPRVPRMHPYEVLCVLAARERLEVLDVRLRVF
jgi:hypothetical protein